MSRRLFRTSLVASDASIEAALQPVKLFEGIGEGGRDARQLIDCPNHQPGLAGHQRPHSAASV